jgi:hypothetical protein
MRAPLNTSPGGLSIVPRYPSGVEYQYDMMVGNVLPVHGLRYIKHSGVELEVPRSAPVSATAVFTHALSAARYSLYVYGLAVIRTRGVL